MRLDILFTQWNCIKRKYLTTHDTLSHGTREKLKAPAAAFFTTQIQKAGINCSLYQGKKGFNRFNRTARSGSQYWTGLYFCKHCNNRFELNIEHEPTRNFEIKVEHSDLGCLEKMSNISCSGKRMVFSIIIFNNNNNTRYIT
jgi:hypothetical protein